MAKSMKCKNKKCIPVRGDKYIYCRQCKLVLEVIQ